MKKFWGHLNHFDPEATQRTELGTQIISTQQDAFLINTEHISRPAVGTTCRFAGSYGVGSFDSSTIVG